MKRAIRVAVIAGFLLLAGCDGSINFEGHVVTPSGTAATNIPIYVFVDGKGSDTIIWSDAKGHFSLSAMACACDFPVELVAIHPDFGIARYITTHNVLEKSSTVVIRLTEKPNPPTPPATSELPSHLSDKAPHQ